MNRLVKGIAIGAALASLVVSLVISSAAAGAAAPVKVIPTPPGRSELKVWQPLRAGQFLQSPDRVYEFVLQHDSNLVLYKDAVGKRGVALWASDTVGKNANYAVLQSDGNLVIRSVQGKAIFTTRTAHTAGVRIQVQNDGNVVIYTASTKATWSTRTVQKA